MLTNLQLTSVSTLYHNWSERDCLVKIIGLVTDFMSNMHYMVGLEDIVSIPKQYTKYVVSYHSVLYNDYYIFEVILDTSTKHLRSSFVPHYYGGSSGWNSGDTAYFWNSFTIQKTSPNGFLLIWFSRYHKHAIPIPSKKRLVRYLRNRLAREVPKLTLLPLGDQYKIVSWTIKDLNRDLPVVFHSYLSEEIGEPGENLSTIGYETLELVYRELVRLPLPAEIILLINSEYVKMVKEEFLSRVF